MRDRYEDATNSRGAQQSPKQEQLSAERGEKEGGTTYPVHGEQRQTAVLFKVDIEVGGEGGLYLLAHFPDRSSGIHKALLDIVVVQQDSGQAGVDGLARPAPLLVAVNHQQLGF